MADYHVPVLGQEVCDKLITDLSGKYLDGTLGGGGHAELILNKLNPDALYIGVDRDSEAIAFAEKRLTRFPNFISYQGLFSAQQDVMEAADVQALDGILLDLGENNRTRFGIDPFIMLLDVFFIIKAFEIIKSRFQKPDV